MDGGRPIYPNLPYSPYSSPCSSPRYILSKPSLLTLLFTLLLTQVYFIQTFLTHPTLHPAPHPGIFYPNVPFSPYSSPCSSPRYILSKPSLLTVNYCLKTKANNKCCIALNINGNRKLEWARAVKSKPKALQHFKVDPVLEIDETVYKQAESLCTLHPGNPVMKYSNE